MDVRSADHRAIRLLCLAVAFAAMACEGDPQRPHTAGGTGGTTGPTTGGSGGSGVVGGSSGSAVTPP